MNKEKIIIEKIIYLIFFKILINYGTKILILFYYFKVQTFIIGQLNINHKVLKEGTKNIENDGIKLSEP
jgi:hypothetical protein